MHTDYESAHLREAKRQQNVCACVCLWCSILTIAIVLVCITVGIRFSGSHDVSEYPSTVGDTRLISYSPALCSGGEMTVDTDNGYKGGMFFLDEKPPLSIWNILWLRGNFVIDPNDIEYYNFYNYDYDVIVYVAWEFHLNEGSEIKARSCVWSASGGSANFLVIQGSHNYNRWINNPSNSFTAYETALASCGSGQTYTYTFSIEDEAYYYVVYYATAGAPQISLNLNINRTEYSLEGVSGMPNCTLDDDDDGSCDAESQSSSRYVLFQTIPANPNITQVLSFTLEWTCFARDGVYLVIFFVPLIILSLLLFGCFGIYCLFTGGCRRSSYSELHEDHTHIHSQPVSQKVPPPYSAEQPVSEKAPPPYGSGPI